MLRHLKVFMLCFIVLLLVIPTAFASPTFPDVPEDYIFFEYIEAIYAAGITVGDQDGNYLPRANVTRGQMAAFIARALDLPDAGDPANPTFPDVPGVHVFFEYIEAIYIEGITIGDEDGNYLPGASVTRGQMAAFIARALDLDVDNPPDTPSFPDVAPANIFFKYIEAIYAEGITEGDQEGNFLPFDNITRGQMAAFLARAFGLLEYTVTFEEANELADVLIQVYDDEERTSPVGDPLTTDGNGIATVDLPNGNYWFSASLDTYFKFDGSFVVAGAAKTVGFEMAEGIKLIQTESAKGLNSVAGGVTASFGTNPQEGSLLIAFSGNRTSGSAPEAGTMAGWTPIDGMTITEDGQNRNLYGWWKVAGPGESTDVSVKWDTGSNHSWLLIREFHGASNYNLVANGNEHSDTESNSLTFPDPALSAGDNDNILAVAGMMLRKTGSSPDLSPTFTNVALGGVYYNDYFDNDAGARMEAVTAFTWTQDGSGINWQTTATFPETNTCWSAGILGLFTFDPVAP